MRIAVVGPLGTLNPEAGTVGWATVVEDWIFEPLVRVDPKAGLAPALAKTYQWTNAHALKLELRDQAVFSDGSPVTLAEVSASLKVVGLRVRKAEGAILVESEDATAPLADAIVRGLIFKKTRAGVVGTGPFVVAEQDENHLLVARQKPAEGRINQAVLTPYSSPREAFAHTLRGDADLLLKVEARDVEFFDRIPQFKVIKGSPIHTLAVGFNPREEDVAERKALLEAIGPEEISKVVFGDNCTPVARARSLRPLAPGRPLNLLTVASFERVALAVRRSLGARGGEIEIVAPQAFVDRVRDHHFDLAILRPPTSSVTMWRTGGLFNYYGYSNKKVDAALDAGDLPAATAALEGDPPAAFICHEERIAAVDSRIKNPVLGPYGLLETLPEWEIAP